MQGGKLKSPHTIEVPFAFDNIKIAANLTGGGAEALALAGKVATPGSPSPALATRIPRSSLAGQPSTPKTDPRW